MPGLFGRFARGVRLTVGFNVLGGLGVLGSFGVLAGFGVPGSFGASGVVVTATAVDLFGVMRVCVPVVSACVAFVLPVVVLAAAVGLVGFL